MQARRCAKYGQRGSHKKCLRFNSQIEGKFQSATAEFKGDKTRLKNLLRLYRDHLITNRLNKYTGKTPSKVVDEIDDAILIINKNL